MSSTDLVPVFDLDGTLLDSDDTLIAPFLALGASADRISWGLPLAEACERLGVSLDDYVVAYDVTTARPFPGVDEMLAGLGRWAVCSSKLGDAARQELERLGWEPEVALFAEEFDGAKELGPVTEALGLTVADVVLVGDSEHDRNCARRAGAIFALAGWNPRVESVEGDVVLDAPSDLPDLLARSR